MNEHIYYPSPLPIGNESLVGNWDNFFEKMEDLKIVEHKNGSIPQYVFNSYFCYSSKEN